ncbi:MAG TPA: DUF167 domain-containing protein [Alphaproteobacteria bacterium]|nr:DUF167 domain-containing protein [Alphaproteobacteria bacterium]
MQINVRVIPRAKQNKVTIEADGGLRIHTTTVPADGKANEAVIKLLSEHFKVPKSKIEIIRGFTSRDKVVIIQD